MATTPTAAAPEITPPYGFQEVVALVKTHRVLLPKGPTVPVVFRTMNPIPVSYTEFPIASCDYPLVFISADEGKSYAPMLILGLAAQQNLFVMPDDTWDRRAYLPAYVRRFPFCMTRVMLDGKEAPERVACVEKIAINDKGEKLFDDKGQALPEWEQREKLLFEFEADLGRTEEMCKLIAQHQLLEPFTMQATPNDGGEPMQLTGMFRVAEEKLAQLDGAVLKDLAAKGVLGRIYAHLISLDNFRRLLDRRAALNSRPQGKGGAKKSS
ncbi:MAG: sapC family protein [Betaproteobacteria bacterium]|nr:sapC family protein [Betaproteobacteria bacterium]